MSTYDNPGEDFKAISKGAKNSPEFRKMTGEPLGESEEGTGEGSEAADLRAAFDAEDSDTFAANMLAAIKSCIANYGPKK